MTSLNCSRIPGKLRGARGVRRDTAALAGRSDVGYVLCRKIGGGLSGAAASGAFRIRRWHRLRSGGAFQALR